MAAWFSALELRHQTPTRIRFTYRCTKGAPILGGPIQDAVACLPGVKRATVNPAARSLAIEFDPAVTGLTELQLGLQRLNPDTALAAGATAPISVGPVVLTGTALLASSRLALGLQQPAAIGAALPVFEEAIEDLLHEGVTSHVLEAVAIAISIGRKDYLAANTTSFLLALGEYLERSIERRSDDLLKHLLHPSTPEVWVERDGAEILLDAKSVRVGDTVIAATGNVVPVDGTVLGGEALVNESTMTGESVPVVRKRGDRVLSGTLVDEGRIRIYAERVGAESAAARIAAFVEQSLSVKSKTQLEAARLADKLVPTVIGLAGLTWFATGSWDRVAAILQADYSCALKLATPVAFKAAMARGGHNGILIKGAGALERLAAVDTFVFDKTGTLTSGQLRVTDAVSFNKQFTPEDLINLAASVEEHYFHPLAQAVVAAAHDLGRPHHFHHSEVEFVVAHGVASVIKGQRIVVGSRHFIEDDEGISLNGHHKALDRLQSDGKTLLYIGFGGSLLGVIALTDTLRTNAKATLQRLRELGAKKLVMLTGDQEDRARAMAETLGLDEYHAGLLPDQKAAILARLAGEGAKLAFVGDGVNDAPALTGASVGIAMHHGADVARLAADIALLEDDIAGVADAKALAVATKKLIDSNYKLTLGLNSGILGAAAFGLLSPVAASMLHNGSTIGTLLRALVGAGLPRKKSGITPVQKPQ